ncbi:MAG: T9SS type A sorting domain-containing protein, partial [Ferruginibacter sp.]
EVEVEIISSSQPNITTVLDSLCSGEIIFLSASEIPGADWGWSGPEAFSASTRNTQINEADIENTGWYYLNATRGGCTGTPDSIFINVFEVPVISFSGDTVYAPGSTGLFYINGPEGMTYFWNFFGDADLMDIQIYTEGSDSLVVFWQEREGNMRIEVVGVDANGCFSEEFSLPVHVVDMTSINDIGFSDRISFSPKPADGFIRVRNSDADLKAIQLLDLSGKVILSFNVNGGQEESIYIQDLPSGVYFLRTKMYVEKLIIIHK